MGDRTPDTSVLDQDDPPAESSGAARDAGPDAADEHSGESPAEPVPAETPEERDEPEAPEQSTAPEATADAPSDAEGDEATPDNGAEAVVENDDTEPDEDPEPTAEDDSTAVDKRAEAAAVTDPAEPDEDPEPTAEEDSTATDKGADAAPEGDDTEPDENPAPTAEIGSAAPAEDDDTAKDQGAEAIAEDDPEPTAETDPTEPDEDPEPTAEDNSTAVDEGAEAAAVTDPAEPDEDPEPTAEEDSTATDKGADAAPGGDGTEPDEDPEPTAEDDSTAPAEDDDTAKDQGAEATAEDGSTAADKSAEAAAEDDDPAPDKAPGAVAAEGEPGDGEPAESSESTRTVVLRPLGDAPVADRTVAIDVADLPRAEPPAPPASPIDLLAQLTNTPPPPRTAARTFLRRVKIWTPVVALLALVVLVVQLVRPLPEPTLALDAKASSFTIGGGTFTMPWPEKGQAAVMVAGSGTIGTFGEQKPVPTASVAKIMTAYVILRERPLKRDEPGPRITVDARTVEEGNSKDESRIVGLRVGQGFDLRDMLKMLMIPSGNNVARLLARWHTGSENEAAFVRKMNEAARSLGMKNTTYTDPSGLDKGTVSTAVDQLKLAEAVMKFDSFRQVVALPDADIPGAGHIINNNDLLSAPGLSVRGIKTGSNTPAGGTLSWAAYKTVDGEDRLILGTMMDQHAPPPDPNGSTSLKLVLANSEKVIRAVREALTSATAVRKGQVVGHVDDGLGGRTPVVATRDLKVVGMPGQKLTLTFRDGGKDIVGGAEAGTVVGELTLGGGAGARSVPVALRSEFPEPSVGAKLTRLG